MTHVQPQPKLTLFFPCEDAAVNVDPVQLDLKYGWWEIRKPMYHVFMPKGIRKGFGVRKLPLYYQLSSGHGRYMCIVEMRQLDLAEPKKTRHLKWSDSFTVHCPNELSVIEESVVLKDVPFPTPGQYQFSMKANGEVLPGGTCYLRVFPGEQS